MEAVLTFFKIDEEIYLKCKNKSTLFIKSYFNKTMRDDFIPLYTYLDSLNNSEEEYLEFGADKCSVSDFNLFCEKLNIDVNENLKRIEEEEKKIINEIRNGTFFNNDSQLKNRIQYHFYSRCKKIMFTCKNPNNYMHYFGITGEANAVLNAFEIFCKMATYDDIRWNCRIYI